MAGEASITVRDRYVLVHVTGDPLSSAEVKFTLSKATEQAIESGLDIIVFRETPVEEVGSRINFFHWAECLEDSAFKNRLALVAPDQAHRSDLDFFERVLRNRGIGFRLLSSVEEAIQWITAGKEDQTDHRRDNV